MPLISLHAPVSSQTQLTLYVRLLMSTAEAAGGNDIDAAQLRRQVVATMGFDETLVEQVQALCVNVQVRR